MSNEYENPIEENVGTINFTASFITAVGQEKYNNLKIILRFLSERGYADPIMFGGALRDLYIGEKFPRDYDVEVSDLRFRSGAVAKRIELTITNSVVVDLINRYQNQYTYLARVRALRADAPINSIAMDKEGEISAHPNFERHAKNKVFSVRSDMPSANQNASTKRFYRLRKSSYPDLTLAGSR